MGNWSNSTHRASIKPKEEYSLPEPIKYFFQGCPVKIVENFVRAKKRIIVIETTTGERFEVFMEQLDS